MCLVVALCLCVVLGAGGCRAYGFRNCIQDMLDPGYFKCMQRFLAEASSATADLPANATALNASLNAIHRLPPGTFARLPALRELSLTHNGLQDVAEGAFEGLPALRSLNLSCNALQGLSAGVFHGLHNLSLLLLHNNHLHTLHPDTFAPLQKLLELELQFNDLGSFEDVAESLWMLSRLQRLNLCNNNLNSLRSKRSLPASLTVLSICNNSLYGVDGSGQHFLQNIKWLDLSYNKISDVSSFAKVVLRNLTSLQLAGNNVSVFQVLNVSDIRTHSFDYSGLHLNRYSQLVDLCHLLGKSMRPMYSLRLQSNHIRNMSRNAFSACPPILLLDLSRNRLKSVSCVREMLNASAQSQLRTLVVEHNLLNRLRSCSQGDILKELRFISFRFNRILSVGGWAFRYAPNLDRLHLNINTVAYLDRRALWGLRALTELRLDNNLLTDIYKDTFRDLGNLQTLNMRNNHVSVLFPGVLANLGKLRILDLGGNNIRQLTNASFEGLRNLSNLYLDSNHIERISHDLFSPVEDTLQVLDLKGNKIYYISMKPDGPPPFVNLHKVYDLKLQAQQPYGLKIIQPRFFQGLTSLRDLYLSENKLLYVAPNAFDDLRRLRYLMMADSSNGMGDLPPGIFKNLHELVWLDLENAGIRTLTLDVFGNLTKLRNLVLVKNELRTINSSVMERLARLRYLDLRKCPLSCTCDNVWLQGWLNNSQVQVVYMYNYSCHSGERSFVYSFDTHVCYEDVGLYLFACTFPALLFQMLLPILYHRTYWQLKYRFYVVRAWLSDRWRRGKAETCRFDAFVSYNSCDERWVLEQLVPNLEAGGNPAFRLCLHHRDFQPGKYIIDNIVESIHNSRHTICVISRSYLRSEWCSMEIQLASYRLFDELKDVLVPVFLEEIPERELSAYYRMRKVMLKKTYVTWPLETQAQKLFWAKLRMALAAGTKDEVEGEEGMATYCLEKNNKPILESVNNMAS
ncbi:toll-like receptor 13 [Anolis sagrei]|uniref:toll-like receptor 13 n=1 Tax=Anolis sagrei TaxID=38937 RepID=UPI0035211649